MKKILFFLGLFLSTSLIAQNQKPKESTQINVKKKRDKYGNIIEYDSTYTYTYEYKGNDSTLTDSLIKDFFKNNNFFIQRPWDNLYLGDNLLNFFKYEDSIFIDFNKEIERHLKYLDSLMNKDFFTKLKRKYY